MHLSDLGGGGGTRLHSLLGCRASLGMLGMFPFELAGSLKDSVPLRLQSCLMHGNEARQRGICSSVSDSDDRDTQMQDLQHRPTHSQGSG